MKIQIERTGGVTGIKRVHAIDTMTVKIETAEHIHKLVDQLDFSKKNNRPKPKSVPDQFQYRLRIQDQQRNDTLEFSEFELKDQLQALVEAVTTASKAQAA